MNKKSGTSKDTTDKLVRDIKRKTRKHYSAEEKIWTGLAGLRDPGPSAPLARLALLDNVFRSLPFP